MSEVQIPPPICLALVLCDHVWRDPNSGKYTMIGTFASIATASFPLLHRELGVYVCLTEGLGEGPLRLRICDVDEERDPVFDAQETIRFKNPNFVAQSTFAIQNLLFPLPGEYRVQLFAFDQFISERRLTLELIQR